MAAVILNAEETATGYEFTVLLDEAMTEADPLYVASLRKYTWGKIPPDARQTQEEYLDGIIETLTGMAEREAEKLYRSDNRASLPALVGKRLVRRVR